MICANCGSTPLPPRHTRYCAACSPLASRLWKERHRPGWSTRVTGDPTWVAAGWKDREAWLTYHREYMKRRRSRRREQQEATPNRARRNQSARRRHYDHHRSRP